MTNREFADAVGCHFSTASRWRNGHRLPGVIYLERIRQMLGVSHEDIQKIWTRGAGAFSAYLRTHAFDKEGEEAA